MKKLFGIIPALLTLFLITGVLLSPKIASAADIRTGQTVILSGNQPLKDIYLFGGTLDVNAPVTNDLVAAGGNINLNSAVSNDLLTAGGTIAVHGKIDNTARIAGGNITIDGPIVNDLVAAGGTINVNKSAAVGGDVLMAGGQLDIEGPVKGKMVIAGGNVTINNSVDGNVLVEHAGTLTLGPQAKINGSLTYSASQTLTKDPGSTVNGQITYHYVAKQQSQKNANQAFWAVAFYKLVANIIVCLLFIYFFKRGILAVFEGIEQQPAKNFGIGLLYLLLTPLIGFICLILIWPGMVLLLSYAIAVILDIFFADLYIGWAILRWWGEKSKNVYMLDWKAGIVGPIATTILILIPFLGWLLFAVITLITLGALLKESMVLLAILREPHKKSRLN